MDFEARGNTDRVRYSITIRDPNEHLSSKYYHQKSTGTAIPELILSFVEEAQRRLIVQQKTGLGDN